MRGGSIVLLAWSLLLLVLFAGNWIYEGSPVQIAQSAAAFGLILLWGLAGLLIAGREALRRGPPPPRSEAKGVPEVSFGAAGAGFALATIVFGLVWGHFLVYFGAGLLVLSLGRLVVEVRSERATVRAHRPPAPNEASTLKAASPYREGSTAEPGAASEEAKR